MDKYYGKKRELSIGYANVDDIYNLKTRIEKPVTYSLIQTQVLKAFIIFIVTSEVYYEGSQKLHLIQAQAQKFL